MIINTKRKNETGINRKGVTVLNINNFHSKNNFKKLINEEKGSNNSINFETMHAIKCM